MSKRRRLTAMVAVGAIGAGAVLAGPAVAHDAKAENGGEEAVEETTPKSAEKAERRAARKAERMARRASKRAYRSEMRKVRRMAIRSMRHCHIAEDRLLTADDNKLLALLQGVLAERVKGGELSQERADMKWARWQKRVTVKVAMKTARWAPVLELFGAKDRKELRTMLRAKKGMRSVMKANDISRRDLRDAVREGKLDRWQAVIDLCTSGAPETEKPPAEKEKPPTPPEKPTPTPPEQPTPAPKEPVAA